jgi:hypothetical protein
MLGLESCDVLADLSVVPMPLEESTHPGARMPEQRLVDEIDRRRRAFDVEQDGPYLLQRDAAPRGM